MATERIGYRRLYDAIGCSLTDRHETEFALEFADGVHASVYLGPRPRFGIALMENTKYAFIGGQGGLLTVSFHRDASQSGYPRGFFLEVFCWREVEVSQEMADRFRSQDQAAAEELLRFADEEEEGLKAVADVVSGALSLRLHRQFAMELLNENTIACRGDDDFAYRVRSPDIETLESVGLGAATIVEASLALSKMAGSGLSPKQLNSLHWLMKGWAERDEVAKFMAFFISLEVVLDAYNVGLDPVTKKCAKKIRQLIQGCDDEDKSALHSFFDHLSSQYRPSLKSRFEKMASEANMVSREADVQAFARFYQMRNSLVHGGEQRVRMAVRIEDEDVRFLEDLAERYVCWDLFGDGQVYRSVFR
jgi:hypothetical protein